jgi:hypothetical protein
VFMNVELMLTSQRYDGESFFAEFDSAAGRRNFVNHL